MPELWEKLTFRPNLRYNALDEKIWLREKDRLGDLLGQRGSKTSFGRNSYGCGIISEHGGIQQTLTDFCPQTPLQ